MQTGRENLDTCGIDFHQRGRGPPSRKTQRFFFFFFFFFPFFFFFSLPVVGASVMDCQGLRSDGSIRGAGPRPVRGGARNFPGIDASGG